MPVITLSRELGSGGDEVAHAVADRLGLRLVGHELINQAARQAGVPEVALAEIDELGLLGVKPKPEALRVYCETVAQLVHCLASEGNLLLVGRGGQVLLMNRPEVLHVRLIAPQAVRSERLQARCKVPAAIAAALIDASDRARASYLRRHYQIRWDAPEHYDLVLNMAHLTGSVASDIICVAAERLASRGLEVSA
jgi:cytidylate kinase